MQMNTTKHKVVETAIALFFQKGFHGTSVRDIAEKADVNVSLISYYFKGKQGLLEYVVTDYYEGYLTCLEEVLKEYHNLGELTKLKKVVFKILEFKTKNNKLTSFIQRELSLDSIFVREMTVTYLAKEIYFMKTLFLNVIQEQNKQRQNYLFMQFQGMLLSPYILKNEMNNHILDEQMQHQFVTQYAEVIDEWIDYLS